MQTDTTLDAASTPPTAAGQLASADSSPRMNRIKSGMIFVGCTSVLLVAAFLSPDSRGYGTHEKLGLPPCGFKSTTGFPCATCGMTTSFSHAAHGDLIASFQNQPMGAVLAVMTAIFAVLGLYGLATGASLRSLWFRVFNSRNVIVFGVLLLIAWGYKIYLTTQGFG